MALYLFDIDMTLLDSDGAGREAMERTFVELFGIEGALDTVDFAGRTDSFIVGQALGQHGIGAMTQEQLVERFVPKYLSHLPVTLAERRPRVLAGAHELVTALAGLPDIRLGVATGNFRRAAELKLDRFGLSLHLREGGFGEDSADRAEVVRLAIERQTGSDRMSGDGQQRAAEEPVVVVGDTSHDVSAAKANGCIAVAVATGFSSTDELRAAGPDLLYEDLADTETVFLDLLEAGGIEVR